jgi:polyisoprenoid-binding protein YceI
MRRFVGGLLILGIVGIVSLSEASGLPGDGGPGVISADSSKIEWVGTKPGGKHNGGFKTFTGKLEPATGDVTASKITVDIQTGSIYSDVGKLTNHLKSPDFFSTDTYPKASFVSSKIEKAASGDSTHKITGTLDLHGVKKEISFPAKIVETPESVQLKSTFKIDRQDFDIKYGPGKVDNAVTIKLDVNIPRK